MYRVFISYRRSDSVDITGRLHDRLAAHFGRSSIFFDEQSIPVGLDFRKRLRDSVSQCDALLAIIGDHWLDARNEEGPRAGERRLDDAQDYVASEIKWALALGAPVVPVLVGHATMPKETALPSGLKDLAFRNAAEVRSGPDFHGHVDRLVRRLEELELERQLSQELQCAAAVLASDAELALLRARKLLETVVRRIQAQQNKDDKEDSRSLRELAQTLVSAGLLPDCTSLIQTLCEVGTKPLEASAAEARQLLLRTMEILEWYRDPATLHPHSKAPDHARSAGVSPFPTWKDAQLKLEDLLEDALERSSGGPLLESDQTTAVEICARHRLPPEFVDDLYADAKARYRKKHTPPCVPEPETTSGSDVKRKPRGLRRLWAVALAISGLSLCLLCCIGTWMFANSRIPDTKSKSALKLAQSPREKLREAPRFSGLSSSDGEVKVENSVRMRVKGQSDTFGGVDPIKTHPDPIKKHPDPPRTPVAGEIWTNPIGMKFAWIPPGKFMRGSPKDEEKRTGYEAYGEATVKNGLWMGTTEVTQEQWRVILGETPAYFKGDDHPVEQVSWRKCLLFCEYLTYKDKDRKYRLPTELEWEYACRAGSTTPFNFVDPITTEKANYNGKYVYGGGKPGEASKGTAKVGSYPPNAWNLYDMHGNVWEWCSDVTDNNVCVIRGGSWFSAPEFCRSAYRHWDFPPHNGSYDIGMRACFSGP